jgi:hypothetical protein
VAAATLLIGARRLEVEHLTRSPTLPGMKL